MTKLELIPSKYYFLSGSVLKLLAVVSMLIDHTASVLLQKSPIVLLTIGRRSLKLYTAMRLIGRLAFPIFAFLLVEGFLHTRDRKKYGIRLLAFAVISEIPWDLEHAARLFRWSSQNVFFTLFVGYLGLCVVERLLKSEEGRVKYTLALLALLVASVLLKADYGCSGFGFILTMYLLREQPLFQAVVGSCFLGSRWQAGFAFIPLNLYNGKRGFIKGRVLQVLFYAVYPLHMLLLYYIRLKTIGY